MNNVPWEHNLPNFLESGPLICNTVQNDFIQSSQSVSSEKYPSFPTGAGLAAQDVHEQRHMAVPSNYQVMGHSMACVNVSYVNNTALTRSNMYPPLQPLTERKAICEGIKDAFFREEGRPIVAVAGMVGVGKTETVRYFVKTFCAHMYRNIVWINAETRTSVVDTLQQFAFEKLKWSPERMGYNLRFVQMAVTQICREETLLIFDNATSTRGKARGTGEFDLISFIQQTLVTGTRAGILITTRDHDWDYPVKVVKVDVFDPDECYKYLSSHINSVTDFKKNWEKLSFLCGCLPITMEVAAQSIKESYVLSKKSGDAEYTIEKFLEECGDQPGRARNMVTKSSFINSVFKQLNVRQAKDSLALLMITSMSFLSPNGVPRSLLHALVAKGDTNVETIPGFQEAIVFLTSKSLMKMSKCSKYFYIHRFIQDARVKFLHDSKVIDLEADAFSEKFLKILELVNSKTDNYVNNLEHAAHSCRVLSKSLHRISVQKLFQKTANMYSELHLPTCVDLKSQLLDYYRKESPQPQPKLRRNLMFDLAKTVKHVDPKRCSNLLRPLVSRADFGKLDRSFEFKVRRLYAYSFQKQGRYPESQENYDQLMQLLNCYKGCSSEKLETQYDIGVLHISMGKHKDALKDFELIYESTLARGYEIEVNIKSRLRIAECKKLLGDYDESLRIYSHIHSFQVEKFGHAHPYTIATQFAMAEVLIKKNCFSEAAASLTNVGQQQNRLLGYDHPDTLITRCRLAEIYLEQGEYDEAANGLQDVFQCQKITLGEGHPSTLATECLIGEYYKRMGNFKEALIVFNRIYLGRVTALTAQHPDTLEVLCKLGEMHMEQSEFDEARSCFDKIRIQKEKCYGKDHATVLHARIRVGLTFLLEGRLKKSCKKALEYFSSLHTGCVKQLSQYHEVTLTAALYAAIALRQINVTQNQSLEPALARLRNVLMLAGMMRNPRDPFSLQVEYEIGITLDMKGDTNGARQQLQSVYEAQERVLGPYHLDCLNTRHHLALVLQKLGNLDLAGEFLKDVLRRRGKILGLAHKLTLETESRLGELQGLPSEKITLDGGASMAGYTNTSWDVEKARLENYLAFNTNVCSEAERRYGENDPQVLCALHRKGVTLRELRRASAAFPVLKDVYERRRKLLGVNHKDFQDTSREYAKVLLEMGQYQEAYDLSYETLCSMERCPSLMTFNYDIVASKRLVAASLLKLGNYELALVWAENVHDECRQMTPDMYNQDVLQALYMTAEILIAQGNFESALVRSQKVYDNRVKQLASNDPQVLSSRHQRAVINFRSRKLKLKGSCEEFKSVVNDRERVLGSDHPDTLNSQLCYAKVLIQYGQTKPALDILDKLCGVRETMFGQYHPDTMEVKRFQAIGTAASSPKNHEVALHNLGNLLQRFQDMLGVAHPLTQGCRNSIMYVSSLKELSKSVRPEYQAASNGGGSVFGVLDSVKDHYVNSFVSKVSKLNPFSK